MSGVCQSCSNPPRFFFRIRSHYLYERQHDPLFVPDLPQIYQEPPEDYYEHEDINHNIQNPLFHEHLIDVFFDDNHNIDMNLDEPDHDMYQHVPIPDNNNGQYAKHS
jgi:hypothetical protein